MPKSLRKNPGWKLEQETIDIVAAARGALNLTNAEVIDRWANAWQKEQAAARVTESGPVAVSAVAQVQDKPVAVRIETPYQIERRVKLERLRAQLASGETLQVAAELGVKADEMTFPFKVLVNGENHEVIEYKGRRILQWVGPTSKVMMKPLTPQETVIYWKDRVVE